MIIFIFYPFVLALGSKKSVIINFLTVISPFVGIITYCNQSGDGVSKNDKSCNILR